MADLKFTVDSALLSELGEKLVETVHLALAELVKNSYDADATLVEITFSEDQNGEMQIVISDNGTGMNFDTINKYWMRIATTNKVDQRASKVYGRPLSGAKGIGRFSSRRLGEHLKIVTRGTRKGNVLGKQSAIEKTIVDFNWEDFVPGEDITTIKCLGEQKPVTNEQTGTELIITGVPKEEWKPGGYNWLKRQLAVLVANRGIAREGYEEDPGFEVNISAPNFDGGKLENLRDNLLKAGWGTLKATVNKKGHAVCKLDALDIGKREIISSDTFPLLDDVSLELAVMVDDREQIRDLRILNLTNLTDILNDWGGVQIRYKGIRVYPYGNDDWLEIDHDRGLRKLRPERDLFAFAQTLKGVDPGRSLINMLSMKNYVGSVEIGESAKGFELKLNREGFIFSNAYEELIKFVRFAIDWSTILRDFYIRQQALKKADKAKEEFETVINEKIEKSKVVDSAITHLRAETKVITEALPVAQKRKFEAVFESATEAIKKQHEANQVELTHLRLVASTSTLLLIFSHEVKTLLGVLEQSKNTLNDVLAPELNQKQKKTIADVNSQFIYLKDRLSELLNMTSLVGGDSRRAKPGQVALLERVKKVEKVFELITNKYNITIDHSRIPNNIAFRKILEAEVYSVLLNVISNSIKSVIAEGGNNRIELSAERENGMNVIVIRDTGIGLDPSRYEEVFTPFISDPDGKLYSNLEKRINPADNMIVGSGSGLGLGIVKEIVVAHGGSIRFKKPLKNWNSELEIKLP